VRDALGEPIKRVGSRAAWRCPFHDDHNPSFTVDDKGWRCWACGIGGDAAAFLMRHEKIGFPEAVRRLGSRVGLTVSQGSSTARFPDRSRPVLKATPRKPKETPRLAPSSASPSEPCQGLERPEAEDLVVESAARLWRPEGREALDYLRSRGLAEETIRRERLGWTPKVMLSTADGLRYWRARGIVIPWFDGDRLVRVKLRQPDGSKPRYVQAFADGPSFYPDTVAIDPARPLVIAEGELDALLLGQELGERAAVVTLGSASERPSVRVQSLLLDARNWYLATDADEAGDKAVAKWASRAIRVTPPEGNDWTECHQAGVDLGPWWRENVFADPAQPAPEPSPGLLIEDGRDDRPPYFGGLSDDRLLKPANMRYPTREEWLARAAERDRLIGLGLAPPWLRLPSGGAGG
jgi:hypothetical protein